MHNQNKSGDSMIVSLQITQMIMFKSNLNFIDIVNY